MSGQRIAVFPDTNVFLHYRPINEIDWCTLLQASTVKIQIAPVVTHELEDQKVLNQSRKIRERAAKALRLLHSYLSNPYVREGVTLEFLINEESHESAKMQGLNLQLGDDRLIATIFLYKETHASFPCVLVTSDLPLIVKATHYGLEHIALEEKLQLPQEPDAEEKKIRQLEAELLKYKSREPLLDLVFGNGEHHMHFPISFPNNIAVGSEAEIKAKLEQAKEKYPILELKLPQDSQRTSRLDNPIIQMTQQIQQAVEGFAAFGRQVKEDYNKRVNTYYDAYEQYLRDALAFETLDFRTVQLNLVLENSGTCPAEDIHIFLHFPDGFTLYDEEHAPDPPEEPKAPSRELDWFPQASLLTHFPSIEPRYPLPRDPNLPTIRKTNSYDVTFERQRLKHGFGLSLTPLFVVFDSLEKVSSFAIRYTISAANIIEEKRGELAVIVEKGVS